MRVVITRDKIKLCHSLGDHEFRWAGLQVSWSVTCLCEEERSGIHKEKRRECYRNHIVNVCIGFSGAILLSSFHAITWRLRVLWNCWSWREISCHYSVFWCLYPCLWVRLKCLFHWLPASLKLSMASIWVTCNSYATPTILSINWTPWPKWTYDIYSASCKIPW